jgi:hypothetical protein
MAPMQEYIPEELDIFTQQPLLMSVANQEVIECSSLNSVENSTIIEFKSSGFMDKYKDLGSVFLKLKLRLMKSDGTKYDSTKPVEVDQPNLVNNALHSLFKGLYISLNGTSVHSVEDNYHYKEYIESTMNFGIEYASTRLSTQLYLPRSTPETLGKVSYNSKTFDLYGKINVMCLDRLLIPGVDVIFRFSLENSDFYIQEDPTKKSLLKLLDAKLYVRHVTPISDLLLSHEKFLSAGKNAIYEFKRGVVITQNIPIGVTSLNIANFYNGGIRPSLAIFCMVENSAYVGSRAKNPFEFKPFELTSFNFIVNGSSKPSNGYEMRMTKDEKCYSQVFSKIYEAMGYHNTDKSALITMENFEKDHFFIAHDLTNSNTPLSDINEGYSNVTIGVNGSFATPLKSAVTCLLYLLLPSRFEITGKREVKIVV